LEVKRVAEVPREKKKYRSAKAKRREAQRVLVKGLEDTKRPSSRDNLVRYYVAG
jgi:hypothetical protein